MTTRIHIAKGLGYYPTAVNKDNRGLPLCSLQDYLNSRADYVSVAIDRYLNIPYGTKLRISEIENKYGRHIEFRVVDSDAAFDRKGFSQIGVCVQDKVCANDMTINGSLTLRFE